MACPSACTAASQLRSPTCLAVGPAFFTTMQIPILAGRDIEERDRPGSPAVAVINEVFAKTNFGRRNPLGQHLILWKARAAGARYGDCRGCKERALWRIEEGHSAGGVYAV